MKVKLNKVRLSFAQDIFTASEFKPGDGKFRYNGAFSMVKGDDNDKKVEAAILAAADETWGAKAKKTLGELRGQKTQDCYRPGNEEIYGEGAMVLASHSKTAPGVFTHRLHNGKVCHLTEGGGTFQVDEFGKKVPVDVDFEVKVPYSGCYVNATVDIYCQTGENPGVRASVTGVQFHSDGEAFGGGRPASADEFDDVTEGADADDFS